MITIPTGTADDYYEMFHGLNPISVRVFWTAVWTTASVGRTFRTVVDHRLRFWLIGNDWALSLPMDFVNYPVAGGYAAC